MQHCAHVAAYYKHLAGGSICEHALAAAFYELASRNLNGIFKG